MKNPHDDHLARYVMLALEDENDTAIDAEDALKAYDLIWEESGRLRSNYKPPDAQENWVVLKGRIHRRTDSYRWIAGIAASVLLVLSLHFFFSSPDMVIIQSLTNPILDHDLPDGSFVSLMSNSELSFTEHENLRALSLSGGGFFAVEKDPKRPFLITTETFRVQVIGTSFFVSDGTWGQPYVQVESGLVQVIHDKDTFLLSRGEQIYFDPLKKTFKQSASDQNLSAWKTGILIFDEAPMAEVAEVLEGNFQTTLTYDTTSKGLLSAKFKDQTLEDILHLIHVTLDIEIREDHE